MIEPIPAETFEKLDKINKELYELYQQSIISLGQILSDSEASKELKDEWTMNVVDITFKIFGRG